MKHFTAYFRRCLDRSKMSQEVLAKKIGLSQSAVSKIYNGKNDASVVTLHKLSKVLPGFDINIAADSMRKDFDQALASVVREEQQSIVHYSEPVFYETLPPAILGLLPGDDGYSFSTFEVESSNLAAP